MDCFCTGACGGDPSRCPNAAPVLPPPRTCGCTARCNRCGRCCQDCHGCCRRPHTITFNVYP